MSGVKSSDIEQLTRIANRLPKKQGDELIALIGSWQECARASRRQNFSQPVQFKSNGKVHAGNAKDLSTSGIFIEAEDCFEVGEQVTITFNGNPLSNALSGTVVRHSSNGVGIRFNYEHPEEMNLIDELIGSASERR